MPPTLTRPKLAYSEVSWELLVEPPPVRGIVGLQKAKIARKGCQLGSKPEEAPVAPRVFHRTFHPEFHPEFPARVLLNT
ncbi:hypothetical protein QCA50_012112 [Cerrena zonata]|uniref:Uncharacterized protein n=1 Tax=Cerrena zonata TaxID=2478898 RepID=A0AAW0FT95_9APHY